MVPFVWGFSAKWLPTFLGTRPLKSWVLGSAVIVHFMAVVLGSAGFFRVTTALFVISVLAGHCGSPLIRQTEKGAKTIRYSQQLPIFRSQRIRMVDGCCDPRRLGGKVASPRLCLVLMIP